MLATVGHLLTECCKLLKPSLSAAVPRPGPHAGLRCAPLSVCSWFFVAGEREAITKEVSKVANKIGLDL